MSENIILASFGPFSITAYSLLCVLGALLAVLTCFLLKRQGVSIEKKASACIAALLGGLLGARILYCATMIETILADYAEGASFIPQLWLGGYTLYGGVLGGLLGLWLVGRKAHMTARLADLMAPGAALFLLVARLAERFTSQGMGAYMDDEGAQFFPVAVQDLYEMWRMPVFLYEALAALVIFVICLVMVRGGKAADGETAETFLALLSLTQMILDSLREDEYIRFGFVHLNMICAAVVLIAVLGLRLNRSRTKQWKIWRTVLFFLGIGGCIGIEFALDKSTVSNVILYAIMAVVLVMMGVTIFAGNRKADRERNGAAA